MTEAEEQQLRSLADDLAGAANSAGEPRCIVHAFATPEEGVLGWTMQQWIDLEAIRSPLLRHEPISDLKDLRLAAEIFGLPAFDVLDAEEAAHATLSMQEAIDHAFGMALPMKPELPSTPRRDGFGMWLPLMAFLEVECRKSRTEARSYPVAEALALLAAARRADGWEPKAETYAERDILEKEDARG